MGSTKSWVTTNGQWARRLRVDAGILLPAVRRPRQVLGALVVFAVTTLSLSFFMLNNTQVTPSEKVEEEPLDSLRLAQEVHVLIPAPESSVDLCKNILSQTILGWPRPTLISWNQTYSDNRLLDNGFHLAKITSVLEWLDNEQKARHHRINPKTNMTTGFDDAIGFGDTSRFSFEDEHVIVMDGPDIWAQLPLQTVMARYQSVLEDEDNRIARRMGSAARKEGIKSKVLFGASKRCSPNDIRSPACYSVPASPLPADVFGPATDTTQGRTPWDLARQRWLDSGFIMGTVKDVRRVFETAKHKIDLCVRKGNLGMDAENGDAGALCYSGSYQSVFVEMMGQQEFHREVMRRHHRTAFERALDWIFPQRFDGSAPPVSVIENEIIDDPLTPSFGNGGWKPEYRPNKPLELGITLDYFSSVAHQTADALHNTAYIVHSQPLEPQLPSEPTDCESAQAPWPADLVPHDTLLLLFKATYGGPIEWEGLPLYTDLCTGSIPALVHHNSADMSSREPLWERNWWNGTARQLLHFRQEQAREMGTLELTGGARTDTGLDLTWEELCPASMESKLFGDL